VECHYGNAYFNLQKKDAEGFSVEVVGRRIRLPKSAQFRLQLQDTAVTLAVTKGEVKVAEDTADNWTAVGKNETFTIDLGGGSGNALAKEVNPYPDDNWDKQRNQYRESYASSDLSYYGNYNYVAPYGYVWRPTFAPLAWNPFADGAWVSYPGFGYTWVSGYPWGWTPYHYGSWFYIPVYGWCWSPQGGAGIWSNVPTVLDPPRGFDPPHPPKGGTGVVIGGRGPSPGIGPRRRPLIGADLRHTP